MANSSPTSSINPISSHNPTKENTMSVRTSDTHSPVSASSNSTRTLLWLLLAASATGNVVTSVAHLFVVSIVFGVITLSLGATLVKQHYQGRRR